MKIEEEIRFFDEHEALHGDYDVLGDGAYRQLLRSFSRLVRPGSGELAVDLGCGTGAFTRRLLAFGLDVTGVDISQRSVAKGNSQSQGEKYMVGDIRATNFPDHHADIITYSGVLHHCPEDETRVAVLEEGFRILKPGGRMFAFDPNLHSPSMFLFRDPRSPFFSPLGKTENEVLLSKRQLQSQLKEAGFRNIQVHGIGGITFGYVAGQGWLLPLYNGVYEQALRLPLLGRFLGTFLVSFGVKQADGALA